MISTHYLAMVELAKKFPSADILEGLSAALEVEPHEYCICRPLRKTPLDRLQVTVVATIERLVTEAIEKALSCNRNGILRRFFLKRPLGIDDTKGNN